MGKFSAASNVNRELENIRDLAEAEVPVKPQPEPTPEAGIQDTAPEAPPVETKAGQSAIDALLAAPVQEGIEQGLAVEQEAQRPAHQIKPLRERAQEFSRVDRWLRPVSTKPTGDGGIMNRARAMATNAMTGKLTPVITPAPGSPTFQAQKEGRSGPEVADVAAQEAEGSLIAAINRAGAVEKVGNKSVPNQQYSAIASAVTENMIADLAYGQDVEGIDPIAEALGESEDAVQRNTATKFSKAAGNARLGQQIHQEYQRAQGIPTPEKLPPKEAETLGDAYKEMWARTNPNLVNRFVDPGTRQAYYQLTAEGQRSMEAGAVERKRMFPKANVRPSKTPLPQGQLPGDIGQNVTKRVSGKVGKQQFSNTIQEATRNLATVPNVVDKQRAKILYSTILPVLLSGDHNTWMAEINNFGPSKLKKYAAALKDQQRKKATDPDFDEEPYNPDQVLASLTDKIAQEVRAVAMERNGANYLTYGIQAYNGRIAPQQTFFDPTSSKAVRFVTRNAVPARATPGSRIEKNLRQMYAMMLVKGADSKLPEGRDLAVTEATPQLEAWGDRLTEALAMSDAEYEAISQAIEQGIPLTDPNFPKFNGLNLDPQQDAELIKAIESKGEDGPHFIDGLIDFAKYIKAKRDGKPHHSYFNAYIDGKTNGLASNGIQMGHMGTAKATGVFRHNVQELLDEGDLRDQLKNLAVESIRDGWDGNVAEYEAELNDVAEALYSYRNFNKATTMTFGYGKEIQSFKKDIEDYLGLISEERVDDGTTYNSSLAALDEKMSRSELAGTLLNKYEQSLREVLSDDALDSRALMRSAAMLHSATNSLFSIKSYTGMDLNFGRDVSLGAEEAETTRYKIADEEGGDARPAVQHYQTEATSSAARNLHGDLVPGEYAYGGSVPGPVQSLDAATVALTSSGRSWDKLKAKSMGNPYLHSIYDAFKMDAMGYDTVMEEVNKNWLDASMNWSYLEETQKAVERTSKEFADYAKERGLGSTLTPNERVYMDWALEMHPTQSGKKMMKNLVNKMSKVAYQGTNEEKFQQAIKFSFKMKEEMKKIGYDTDKPPVQPTMQQLYVFVKTLGAELNVRQRLGKAIQKTNNNKKELKREILKRGYKTPSGERIALQYYAH